jgi:4-alpha-glucanotransferase
VIPEFVRATMKALHVPGYKVVLWERREDGKLKDPTDYDPESVATWSTHDTLPIGAWFLDLPATEQSELRELMGLQADASAEATDAGLFELLFRAGSNLALVLVTELLGETARINTPGTVAEHNWTYRLPGTLESLMRDPKACARMTRFAELLGKSSR